MIAKLSMAALAALAALVATPACADVPPPRPMDQMHGGCDAFAWNMSHEFHAWEGEAAMARAGTNVAAVTPALVGKAIDVTLAPQPDVAFAAIPEQQRGGQDTFAGLVSFTPPAPGVWRVSASTGLWIDAVSAGALVKSAGFEMQTGCATIFKSVAYHLPGGAPVVLQLSGSKPQAVRILVTPWVDGGHDAHAAHATHEADDAVPADDAGQITHIMKAQFDRPDAPLAVEPVAVGGEWAVASWRQDGKGGRALLKKGGHGWSIHLCSGASLKDGMKLAEIGVPHEQAMSLATHLADAEGKLPAEAIAQFDSFEGTVMIEGGAHPSGGHDAHNQHSQQN
ncbi:MAG: copper uptake system-associated protein [Phyllobacteriaceae bacterium]|nr:copper uptake system-associated protein [Phyllobacteriaceae bacterium]